MTAAFLSLLLTNIVIMAYFNGRSLGFEEGLREGQNVHRDNILKVLASCRIAYLSQNGKTLIGIKNIECEKIELNLQANPGLLKFDPTYLK